MLPSHRLRGALVEQPDLSPPLLLRVLGVLGGFRCHGGREDLAVQQQLDWAVHYATAPFRLACSVFKVAASDRVSAMICGAKLRFATFAAARGGLRFCSHRAPNERGTEPRRRQCCNGGPRAYERARKTLQRDCHSNAADKVAGLIFGTSGTVGWQSVSMVLSQAHETQRSGLRW